MPTGTYSRLSIPATANTILLGSLASTNTAVVTVNLVNTSANIAIIRLAITSNTSSNTVIGRISDPAANNAEWIEFNTPLAPSGVLERTGIVLQTGLQITAWSNTAGITAVTYGIETIA